MFAVSSTMIGHFPPSYRMQGVRFFAASIPTSRPVTVEPVKQIKSNGNLLIAFAISTLPSMHL